MKWIGKTVGLVGMYFVYMVTFSPDARGFGGPSWEVIIVAIAAGAVLVFFGNAIAEQSFSNDQAQSDSNARSSFDRGDLVGKSLYLRPFENDGNFVLTASLGAQSIFSWDHIDRPGKDSLERLFSDAFAKTTPLIGLGGRGEVEFGLGAASLVSDWKAKISMAISQAEYVLVIPSANEGTLWELSEIVRQDKLVKTVFIMPAIDGHFSYLGKRPYEEIWHEARKSIEDTCGLEFPEFDPKGKLFKMKADGSLDRWVKLKPKSNQIVSAINTLFQ